MRRPVMPGARPLALPSQRVAARAAREQRRFVFLMSLAAVGISGFGTTLGLVMWR